MAAISFYHHQSTVKAKDEVEIFNKASAFTGSTYFSALVKGNQLTDGIKRKIAKMLSQFIGLSPDSLLARDLRITPEDFQVMLLAGQDKRIGILDGRKTGPLHTDLKPPFSDPSMSLGRDTAASRLMKSYFTSNLNFPDTGSYRSLNMAVNSKWNWSSAKKEFYFTVVPEFAAAVKKDPALKIFIAGGIFDMATPLYSAKYQMDHSGIPPGRISFEVFPTGHSIFEDKAQLKILADKIRLSVLK
jgi:carboxypeptidase C (cathepsin A)